MEVLAILATTQKVLSLALALLDATSPAYQYLKSVSAKISDMQAANRDPTPDEWKELDAAVESIHSSLQS